MIKRFPIIKQWQVLPVCDKCESIMTKDNTKTEIINQTEVWYTYVCSCGEIFKSQILYPHGQVEFRLKKGEIIDEQ